MLSTKHQRHAVVALHLIAAGLLVALLSVGGSHQSPWPPVLFLVVSAVAAELLPVHLTRYGLRITLTLPFIAGMAVAVGPVGALVLDLAVTSGASLLVLNRQKKSISAYWMLVNSSTCVISSSLAGLVTLYTLSLAPWERALGPVPLIAYTVTYSISNLALVLSLRAGSLRRRLTHSDAGAIRFALVGTIVYCFISTVVANVVDQGLYLALPLMLVPVLILRASLVMKARMLEHYYETIVALMLMLQRAHPYTHGHLERVARISERVALRLGLTHSRARLVREAAVLHDIGKIAIDERVLEKPGPLTDAEYEHIKLHASFGADILAQCEQFREIVPWIRSHHERPDGKGYPIRMRDMEIPIESKIIAVADAFDAMVGGPIQGDRRAYREPMSMVAALIELERCSGTQFDQRVVRAFSDTLAEEGV